MNRIFLTQQNGVPRYGKFIKIWNYAESSQLYVHVRGDDSDSKQLKGNY